MRIKKNSSPLAKTISPDDMSGLLPSLLLTRDARVMLTMNLWPSYGLCNGAIRRFCHPIFELFYPLL